MVVAIPCSWLAKEREQAGKQRAAVEAIGELRGSVWYDYQCDASASPMTRLAKPPSPAWLRRLLGDDFFANVVFVGLWGSDVTDAAVEPLKGLSQLESLSLGGTKVTGAGLGHLNGLSRLQGLDFVDVQVTGAGLEQLKGLRRLQVLNLSCTEVTDADLEPLKRLSQLRELQLI